MVSLQRNKQDDLFSIVNWQLATGNRHRQRHTHTHTSHLLYSVRFSLIWIALLRTFYQHTHIWVKRGGGEVVIIERTKLFLTSDVQKLWLGGPIVLTKSIPRNVHKSCFGDFLIIDLFFDLFWWHRRAHILEASRLSRMFEFILNFIFIWLLTVLYSKTRKRLHTQFMYIYRITKLTEQENRKRKEETKLMIDM